MRTLLILLTVAAHIGLFFVCPAFVSYGRAHPHPSRASVTVSPGMSVMSCCNGHVSGDHSDGIVQRTTTQTMHIPDREHVDPEPEHKSAEGLLALSNPPFRDTNFERTNKSKRE